MYGGSGGNFAKRASTIPTTMSSASYQRVEKVDGGGEFPRPAAGAPTGAGGGDARDARVPSGGWARVEADVTKAGGSPHKLNSVQLIYSLKSALVFVV
jgi:hypothetical protein